MVLAATKERESFPTACDLLSSIYSTFGMDWNIVELSVGLETEEVLSRFFYEISRVS
ncbi:hypothetical protein Scep_022085 [Stephania cephalantha]|uniref:Uncharacterized protein n=1 Tax=Stephania cephalantha TaxID=152367 RepID=A0AAP0I1W6_9MAGN